MVKTITIMDDAYTALKRHKSKKESFSDIIRRMCKERKINLKQWLGIFKNKEKSAKTITEEIIKERKILTQDFEKRMQKIQR